MTTTGSLWKGFLLGAAAGVACHAATTDRWQVKDRSANTTTWVTHDAEGNARGEYVELASGLNTWEPLSDAWVPSEPAFRFTSPGDAVVAKCQYRVAIAPNLNREGAVAFQTPTGRQLLSTPLAIGLHNHSTGETVLLAQLQDCQAELVDPAVIVFRNAFDNIHGAVRFTATRSGIEQFVILYERVEIPKGWDPESTTLDCYTEWYNPPQPIEYPTRMESGLVDESLDFGDAKMVRGTAYVEGATEDEVAVLKTWGRLDNRDFLIESVPFGRVEPKLRQLPLMAIPIDPQVRSPVSGREKLIAGLQPLPSEEREVLLASTSKERQNAPKEGLVIDYTLVTGTLTDYVFRGDTTYHVTGALYLQGNTVIEGNTVVKLAENSATVKLEFSGGTVDCRTTRYRPAIFTAEDDDTVGEVISGSTGIPSSTGYYANRCLYFPYPSSALDLHDIRVSHSVLGIAITGGSGHKVRHCQLLRCKIPVIVAQTAVALQNVLIHQAELRAIQVNTGGSVTGEHLTIHDATQVLYGGPLTLKNCILSEIDNVGSAYTEDHCATDTDGSCFVEIGAGAHYLTPDSEHRDAGAEDIDPDLWEDLQEMTTDYPVEYTGAVTDANFPSDPNVVTIEWRRQAIRDHGLPDLGYHYPAVDYLVHEVSLDLSEDFYALEVSGGSVVAVAGTYGFSMDGAGHFRSTGRPEALNRFIRSVSVQEQWKPEFYGGPYATLFEYGSTSQTLEARFRFSELTVPAGAWEQIDAYGLAVLALTDCEVINGEIRAYETRTFDRTIAFTNSLFERAIVWVGNSADTQLTSHGRNNLFRNSATGLFPAVDDTWEWRDNVFESSYHSQTAGIDIANSHNAYISSDRLLPNSSNDIVLTTFTYESGPLGDFYQPSTSSLINAGSRSASAASLFHHTTTVDQVKDGEASPGTVDIGLHYVATGEDGLPLDSDHDGLPDYLEDVNGNGVVDAEESDPNNPDSDGDGTLDGDETAGLPCVFPFSYTCTAYRDALRNTPSSLERDFADIEFSMSYLHKRSGYRKHKASFRECPPPPPPEDYWNLYYNHYLWGPLIGKHYAWRDDDPEELIDFFIPPPSHLSSIVIPFEKCEGFSKYYPPSGLEVIYTRDASTSVMLDPGGNSWPKESRGMLLTVSMVDMSSGATLTWGSDNVELHGEPGIGLCEADVDFVDYKVTIDSYRVDPSGYCYLVADKQTFVNVTPEVVPEDTSNPHLTWYKYELTAELIPSVPLSWSKHPMMFPESFGDDKLQERFDFAAWVLLAVDDDGPVLSPPDPDVDDVNTYMDFTILKASNPTFPNFLSNHPYLEMWMLQNILDEESLEALHQAHFANIKVVSSMTSPMGTVVLGSTSRNDYSTVLASTTMTQITPIHEFGHLCGIVGESLDTNDIMFGGAATGGGQPVSPNRLDRTERSIFTNPDNWPPLLGANAY